MTIIAYDPVPLLRSILLQLKIRALAISIGLEDSATDLELAFLVLSHWSLYQRLVILTENIPSLPESGWKYVFGILCTTLGKK